MAGIKLQDFMGLIPRRSDRLLPTMAATKARNTKLLQGELRGFRALREGALFTTSTVERAYRIRDPAGVLADFWLTFDDRNVDIVRSPMTDDSLDRYYWAGSGIPQYNTAARIRNGDPAYPLGIPIPGDTPTVVPSVVGTDETRAYVYTFVDALGQEGPPSVPTVASGNAGTWTVGNMSITMTNMAGRPTPFTKKIYRTVPGQDSAAFFYVATVAIGTVSYPDVASSADVARNSILESTTWQEPEQDMEGFVAMPNGYLVGWAGRRLLFSEPYRPWAWPVEYQLSTEFPIVGMVVWGSAVVIGTKSQPYFGQGVTPASFTTQKMDAVEPCLSRRGMVATVAGAYYPSVNGLILANSNGVQVITQDILTKEEWAAYNPSDIYAAQLGLQYIAFNSPSFGFIFNPTEPQTKLVELDRFQNIVGIETDKYSGDVLVIDGDRAWNWDPEAAERLFWSWSSKQFQTPKPMNFGALRVNADFAVQDSSTDIEAYYGPYNTARFNAAGKLGPLGTLAGHVLCGGSGVSPQENPGSVPGWTEPEIIQPLGGSGLYDLAALSFGDSAIRLVITIDEQNTVVFDETISTARIYRIPTGFKSDLWKFDIYGNTALYSIQIAETAKGLAEL